MQFPRKIYSLTQRIAEHMPYRAPVAEVYMLHEVYTQGARPQDPFCAVEQSHFLAWLDSLPVSQIGTPEQLSVPGSILLTLDDIFFSAYRNAVPVLRQRNLPYTVFIAPGLLGRPDYITPDDLRVLAADPLCTIGAHSMTHCLMRPLSAEACRKELADSKRYLEDFTEREVVDFAFPYGSIYACSKENRQQVSACGFRRGFSTLNRPVTDWDLSQPWFLPRHNVNDTVLKREGF